MSQLRMGKIVSATPEEVLDKAVAFFGRGGLGLKLVRRSPLEVFFRQAGGLVQVTATPAEAGEKTEIEAMTVEWGYDVKRFMASV